MSKEMRGRCVELSKGKGEQEEEQKGGEVGEGEEEERSMLESASDKGSGLDQPGCEGRDHIWRIGKRLLRGEGHF